MAHIKYPQLQNTALLKRLLLVEKKPVDEVCRILGQEGKPIPYNCLNHQIKSDRFTDEERGQINGRRTHYSRQQKKNILKELKEALRSGASKTSVAKKYGLQPHQLDGWIRRFKADKAAREASSKS